MTLSKAIIKRINNLMKIKNIENPHQLALKCGLDESVIRSVLNGRTIHPSIHTIFYIIYYLLYIFIIYFILSLNFIIF